RSGRDGDSRRRSPARDSLSRAGVPERRPAARRTAHARAFGHDPPAGAADSGASGQRREFAVPHFARYAGEVGPEIKRDHPEGDPTTRPAGGDPPVVLFQRSETISGGRYG